MYYFKVPVFTKLSRIHNIIISILQISILMISIFISLYRGCNYESTIFTDGCVEFNILPGNIMITNRTYTSWQFMNQLKYSSENINDLYNINYINIINTTLNNYLLFKGDVVLYDKKNISYDAVFKDSLNRQGYNYDFKNNFMDNVNMNNEIYDIAMKDGSLEIMFLSNCSKNSLLYEKDKYCFIKNNTYNDIIKFLNSYFINENFIIPYTCHNCYINGITSLNEAITVLSKCISIFFMFNSFLIIIYIFIISKIKKLDIGYIDNIICSNINIYKEISSNDINETIKN